MSRGRPVLPAPGAGCLFVVSSWRSLGAGWERRNAIVAAHQHVHKPTLNTGHYRTITSLSFFSAMNEKRRDFEPNFATNPEQRTSRPYLISNSSRQLLPLVVPRTTVYNTQRCKSNIIIR